jgi:hypothetical protein
MVLLHHHLEAVAQIGLKAQKMVEVEMEEDEKPFPHMGSPRQKDYHSSIHQQCLNFLVH